MAHILCIDDEPAALRLRALILDRAGYRVVTATTSGEALKKFQEQRFDLVISDHVLGRDTGTELAADMRRISPDVPILILSGTSEIPQDIGHADAFLSKLEGPKVLLERVADLLALYRSDTKENPVTAAAPIIDDDLAAAYDELRVSQARLSAIIGSTMDAIITVDEEQRIVLFNKAAERIFEYRTQQVLGKPLDNLIPEEVRAAHRVHVDAFGRTGITSRSMYSPRTLNALRASGEEFPIEATISQVEAAGQKLFTVVLRDLSERKRAEEELRKAEKLAVAGRMAATVAHEINNPLETVLNALYLIEQAQLDDGTRSLLSTAQEELLRVTQITKLTLGFYRQEERTRTSVAPCELIDNVLALYGRKFEFLRVKVEKRYDNREPLSLVAGEIRQVFSNLIVNAVDALSVSGSRLVVHVRAARNWKTMEAGVRVFILDDGPGIPVAERARLFELFHTTKGQKGTGIGLWVSQGIISNHGGAIRFRSCAVPGKSGTLFSVFLPR